jgi:MtaA/CmuA family methyltransferase
MDMQDVSKLNRERMLVAAALEEPDQVPVWMDLDCRYLVAPADFGLADYVMYFCPSVQLDLLLEARAKFNGLIFIRPHYNVAVEASAFGCKIRWPREGDTADPTIWPIVKTPEDVVELEVPDPYLDGLYPADLDGCRYMRRELRSRHLDVPLWMGYGIRGPLTEAVMLLGGLVGGQFGQESMRRPLEWMDLHPDAMDELVKKCTENAVAYIRAMWDVVGEQQELMLCDDFSSFLSPEQFERFSLPYLSRIFEEFDHPLNMYHNCHQTNHLIERIPDTQAKIFHLGPPGMCDLGRAKALIGRKICLMGNVNPDTTLLNGTVEEVDADARRCIEAAASEGGFILAEASGVRRGTPDENVRALIGAADKYGKYAKN